MPSLTAVAAKTVWCEPITMFGEQWNIAYHPGVMTPDFDRRMMEVQSKMMRLVRDADEGADKVDEAKTPAARAKAERELEKLKTRAEEAVSEFYGLLGELLCDWDITEADGGPPLPIAEETFKRLPSQLTQAFMRAIREGSEDEGKETPSGSPNGSGSETSSEGPRLITTR